MPFIPYMDASEVEVGAVLTQITPKGEHAILPAPERNYATIEKDGLWKISNTIYGVGNLWLLSQTMHPSLVEPHERL